MVNDRPRVNIHLGARDIFPTLVRKSAAALAEQMRQSSSVFISPEMFKADVQWQLSSIAGAPDFEVPTSSYLSLPSISNEHRTIAISQHATLIDTKGPSTSGILYFRQPDFLLGLEDYFDGANIHVHLIVTCQHDYGPLVDTRQTVSTHVSWSKLATNIMACIPSAHLTVWAIEKPETCAVSFVTTVLGLDPHSLSEAERSLIIRDAAQQRFAQPKKPIPDALEDISIQLDSLYDFDIQKLPTIPRVMVMNADGNQLRPKPATAQDDT